MDRLSSIGSHSTLLVARLREEQCAALRRAGEGAGDEGLPRGPPAGGRQRQRSLPRGAASAAASARSALPPLSPSAQSDAAVAPTRSGASSGTSLVTIVATKSPEASELPRPASAVLEPLWPHLYLFRTRFPMLLTPPPRPSLAQSGGQPELVGLSAEADCSSAPRTRLTLGYSSSEASAQVPGPAGGSALLLDVGATVACPNAGPALRPGRLYVTEHAVAVHASLLGLGFTYSDWVHVHRISR
jgi:hypothetical protein